MKKIYFLLLVLLLTGCKNDLSPREGDIIFQTTPRKEAALIHQATLSPISNCGIVVAKEDEKLYVLTVGNQVQLIPLDKFINSGRNNKFCIKRASLPKKAQIDYEMYLGCSRDIFLRPGDNKFYSAELVYTIFKEQFGIELCEPQPIKNYHIEKIIPYLSAHRIHPEQLVVAPVDLYNSPKLKTINDTYEKKK
ncbi:MAG: hypothetical protein IJ442_03130 [Bacteroidaceae bacterium]|nr:hypothetical protein [Bacteroidaceae bacterium]